MAEPKKEKKRPGRPRKPVPAHYLDPSIRRPGPAPKDVDKELFESLCGIWCTIMEIESIMKTDAATIDKWCFRTYGVGFSSAYERLCNSGKASLRRNQLNLSSTNAAMAIWLGKQKLGQSDTPAESAMIEGLLAKYVATLKQGAENTLKRSEIDD
ncbi:MAG TPA: hypothetical protein PL000_07225 [Anaerolineales bacterium]|nr:hypothetical protein [Anaerolineales bacterium]